MALRESSASNQISTVVDENLMSDIPHVMQEPKNKRLESTKALIQVVFDIETTSRGKTENHAVVYHLDTCLCASY